jgi:hypothetical protein
MNRSKEKREYIEQPNREADDIDANIAPIAPEEATDEFKALAGQEKYQADQEKGVRRRSRQKSAALQRKRRRTYPRARRPAQYLHGMANNKSLR